MYVPAYFLHLICGVLVVIPIMIAVMAHWYIHESHKRIRLVEQMSRDLRDCLRRKI